MDVQVNMLAVILATLSSMVVGAIWYNRNVFGKTWIQLANLDKHKLDKANPKALLLTVVVSFLTAYVLAHVTYLSHAFFGHQSFLSDAIATAFWLWLGLTAARMITHNAFEGRPAKFTVLEVSHEFVTLMVMALIIGLLKP